MHQSTDKRQELENYRYDWKQAYNQNCPDRMAAVMMAEIGVRVKPEAVEKVQQIKKTMFGKQAFDRFVGVAIIQSWPDRIGIDTGPQHSFGVKKPIRSEKTYYRLDTSSQHGIITKPYGSQRYVLLVSREVFPYV